MKANYHLQRNRAVYVGEDEINAFLKEADGTDNAQVKADCNQIAGAYYWLIKDYTRALEHFMYAYQIYSPLPIEVFPRKTAYLREISGKYYYFTDYKTSKQYLLQFLETIKKEDLRKYVSPINTLALCYTNMQQYDSAGYYLNMADSIATVNNIKEWIGVIARNKANIFFLQGKYDEALPLFEKDAELSLASNSYMSAALSLSSCGEIYRQHNEKERAFAAQKQAYELITAHIKKNNYMIRVRVYPNIAKSFAENGLTELAYKLLDTAYAAKDSLVRQKNVLYLMGAQHNVEAEKHLDEMRQKEEEVARQKVIRNSLMAGSVVLFLFTGVFFLQRNRIRKEKKKTDALLLNILPAEVAEELKAKGWAEAKQFDAVTVMFTDFKDFTRISETLTPAELVADIHAHFVAFDEIISRYRIEKIKTIGDSYMCAAGLPISNPQHAQDIVHAAQEILAYISAQQSKGSVKYAIRIGIHTGPVVAGIVGVKKFAYDIWGDTVNTASRLESAGEPGRINISETTHALVKDTISCTYRGKIEAKNKGEIDMYFVDSDLSN